MLNTILVPLDGSQRAECTLPFALDLSQRLASQSILLHVTAASTLPSGTDPALLQAHTYISYLSREYVAAGNRATTVLRRGDTVTEILNEVNETYVDLVVMSTHGASHPDASLMGSIPYSLLYRLPVPLVLVQPKDHQPARRMLVVLDSATRASGTFPAPERIEPAFGMVGMLAQGTGRSVTLFQAGCPDGEIIAHLDPSATLHDVQIHNEYLPRMVESGLQQIVANYALLGIPSEIHTSSGQVDEALRAYLRSEDVDLVVVASQRQSMYGREMTDRLVRVILTSSSASILLYPIQPRATTQPAREMADPVQR